MLEGSLTAPFFKLKLMITTSGKYKPTAIIHPNNKIVILKKICYISKREYWVSIPLNIFRATKLYNEPPNLASFTIKQRRFITTWLTPKEYNALKHDGV